MSRAYIKAKQVRADAAKISYDGRLSSIIALICTEIEMVAKGAGISPVELACTISEAISEVHSEEEAKCDE